MAPTVAHEDVARPMASHSPAESVSARADITVLGIAATSYDGERNLLGGKPVLRADTYGTAPAATELPGPYVVRERAAERCPCAGCWRTEYSRTALVRNTSCPELEHVPRVS